MKKLFHIYKNNKICQFFYSTENNSFGFRDVRT